jgi:hypothetical protein
VSDFVLEVGSDADVTATIKDRDDQLVDPAVVKFTVIDPAAVTTTLTYPATGITRVSTGVYRLTFTVAADGQHFVTCSTTTPSRVVTTSVHGAPSPA